MGDGVLVEFASAVNAVKAALELQAKFAAANEGVADDRRITLRIGINLGDVIGEGSDIYGDGVNIAARSNYWRRRAASASPPRCMRKCMAKSTESFVDLGEQPLKNIAIPVRVFGVGNVVTVLPKLASAGQAKPSIAVLPLTNMSGDPEQEFFADGMTEDIITELSRFKELFVIARNSTFVYKGRAIKIQEVARELGVQYVVEGSVRKAGRRCV